MKMKTIIAVAALACASVASASTNYVEVAKKNWCLVAVVQQMAKDPALADAPLLGEARASVAAKSGECLVSEVGTGEPCALRASVSLKTATAAPVAEPRRLAPLPEPKTGTGCDIISLFETRRFLSAPWSASRRLKAARLRGDEDEARRMEARLGELVEEALGVEEDDR